ncbi:VPS9 domain protein [Aspergillus sclerotialis]|uniref:VPS9 domain protein n=1 Tax=Aspergillus sclerotialis TaxID=2070753 RepID=A0A3A2ZLG2_9EURO|nr:VPS9 domain protein [Aspergillus sclerotialis]
MESSSTEDSSERQNLHQARSFPWMDSSTASPFARTRTKTVQEAVDSDTHPLPLSADEEEQSTGHDLFEKRVSTDSGFGDEGHEEEISVLSSIHEQPEELPIELMSLTDRFINSLSAKVHSSPPTIEKISSLFQDFYSRAESHIATHISTLAYRINREQSPNPPPRTPRGSIQQKLNNKGVQDVSERTSSGRQMLTASEVTEKRKARKFLSRKRVALEEAVERRACEGIYDKIFQHRSTLDEVRDEKLRSKTAALLLVGINFKDLGIDIDITAIDEEKQKDADDAMTAARECLIKMNDAKYPLGKLQQLAAAHKAIVDALTKLLPSSSSADELLPALIYSLVTCPPEGINAISNLLFIQRFRSSNKIYGETAYCLTNLEAAVCFLENVDLSDLRAEGPDGQPQPASDTPTHPIENLDSLRLAKEAPTPSVTSVSASPELLKPNGNEPASATLPRPRPSSSQQRRLSNLFPPSKVLGAANDAVRNTADQSLKNIGATLDNSFNFFFGRLRELQSNQLPVTEGGIPILPKTLAEARRLVAAQNTLDGQNSGQENNVPSETVSDQIPPRDTAPKVPDTTKGLRSASGTPRDRSTDSTRTQNSSKKSNAGSPSLKDEHATTSSVSQPTPVAPSTPTPLESMKNFGNTLNPLNHIPGMIRGFGRPTGAASPLQPEKTNTPPTSAEGTPNLPSSSSKIDPPIQRFIETENADDLTLRDISALLNDYKRLAAALFRQRGEFN